MQVSYSCDDIIEELIKDIKEFGDIDMYAIYEEIEGHLFLTDYNFIEEDNMEQNLKEDFKKNTRFITIMKASKILEILEKENPM